MYTSQMDTQTSLQVSSDDLGFCLSPAEEGENSRLFDMVPPNLTTDEREKLFQALIRQDSLASVAEISRSLAELAMEPTTSVSQKLNINDQLIKLAGLDKKNVESGPQAGAGYQLVINIGDSTTKISAPVAERVDDASV